ncbi:MAG: hypothetical protein HGA16_01140 [Candidatus Moranbacteria bacterium]|nr:hypothetical protein [Candidatus Moranbacteria bacterium]
MNHEQPSSTEKAEEGQERPHIVECDFRNVPELLRTFEKDPEELGYVLDDPRVFLERLSGMNHESDSDDSGRSERFQESMRRLERILSHPATSETLGNGTTNIFSVPKKNVAGIPDPFSGRVGLRETRQVPIFDRRSGLYYLGIPVNHDQPDPVGASRQGTMIQAVGSAIKGILPRIYWYTEERGARDMETGQLIPGLENEVVRTKAVMERLNGPTIAKIIDREGIFWKRRYSARKPEEFMDFIRSEEYGEYIRYSVEQAVQDWPGILDLDWDRLGAIFKDRMRFLNSLSGGASLLFRDGHFGNVALLFSDRECRIPDPRIIGLMDFDLSALSMRTDFGSRLADYLNEAKSDSLGEQFFMPDHLSPSDESRGPLGKTLTTDAVTHNTAMFEVIREIIMDIREKTPADHDPSLVK